MAFCIHVLKYGQNAENADIDCWEYYLVTSRLVQTDEWYLNTVKSVQSSVF